MVSSERSYSKIAGALLPVFCLAYCFRIADCFPGAVPLLSLLKVMHANCAGLCELHAKSCPQVSVVKMDSQQNGHVCGVWTTYAMYWRPMKTVIKQEPANIFQDMDFRCPQQTLRFRFLPHVTAPDPPSPLPMCEWNALCVLHHNTVFCGSP